MTETEIILRSLILSITTIGLVCPFWDGNIFDKVGDKIKGILSRVTIFKPFKPKSMTANDWGEYLAKPLFGCYVCATFWYSLVICEIIAWPLWLCMPAMGVSAVISLLQKD